MIRFERVSKVYPDGTAAVDDLSFEVGEGELVTLVGPSGCGRTTTMMMVKRLIEPTSGRVLVAGDDISTVDPVRLRRRIGYVIQQVGLFAHRTVLDNTATVPALIGWKRSKARERAAELLDPVGLDPNLYGPRYPAQLSGGQRQRVGVARALESAGGRGTVGDTARRMEAWVPVGAPLKRAFSEMLQHDAGWVAVVDCSRFAGVLTPAKPHEALRRSVDADAHGIARGEVEFDSVADAYDLPGPPGGIRGTYPARRRWVSRAPRRSSPGAVRPPRRPCTAPPGRSRRRVRRCARCRARCWPSRRRGRDGCGG